MLAFSQHAVQFFVYFTCSAQFRKVIRKKLDLFAQHIGRFLLVTVRLVDSRQFNPETGNALTGPIDPHRLHYHSNPTFALERRPVLPGSAVMSSIPCNHVFIWADSHNHVLFCYLCHYQRVVHHLSCHYYRHDQRFDCECLRAAVEHEHPAHVD